MCEKCQQQNHYSEHDYEHNDYEHSDHQYNDYSDNDYEHEYDSSEHTIRVGYYDDMEGPQSYNKMIKPARKCPHKHNICPKKPKICCKTICKIEPAYKIVWKNVWVKKIICERDRCGRKICYEKMCCEKRCFKKKICKKVCKKVCTKVY